MADIRVAIAAAGKGRRAGLPYPKTLHPVGGRAILLRIFDLLGGYDLCPTVIVSPEGHGPICNALAQEGLNARLIEQDQPLGMGDAVLRLASAIPSHAEASLAERSLADLHVILVWGDIPLIRPETVSAMIEAHLAGGHDFTFPTRHVSEAYTIVRRSPSGAVTQVVETRETRTALAPGERDIGLFMFRAQPVLAALAEDLPGKLSPSTGEHGFLYIIGELAARGAKVCALPIAQEVDLVSLNHLADLEGVDALSWS